LPVYAFQTTDSGDFQGADSDKQIKTEKGQYSALTTQVSE
jgi:hypothetical protein